MPHLSRLAPAALVAALVAALLLAGCAAPPQDRASGYAPPPDAAQAYQQHVEALAAPEMEGRGLGTTGLERAEAYISRVMQDAGLQPGITGPAGPTFRQPFPYRMAAEAQEQSLAFTHAGRTRSLTPGPGGSFNALGVSASGRFTGEPTFVGYGIAAPERDYDSYRGLGPASLQGKIAIAFRFEPMTGDGQSLWAGEANHAPWTDHASPAAKAKLAAAHGAAALLLVNPPHVPTAALVHTSETDGPGAAPIPVLHISGAAFREMLQAAGYHAQDVPRALQAAADAHPLTPSPFPGVHLAGHTKLAPAHTTTLHNIVGLLPGRGELADEAIVVGAHFDHLGYGGFGSYVNGRILHPGADDNASGVAALLLLADHLASRTKAASESAQPRRAILFAAFSAEEHGLIGSAQLARRGDELAIPLSRVRAMINLDMVGSLRDQRLTVFGADSGSEWEPLFRDHAAAVGLRVRFAEPTAGGSDHTSFYVERIPAVHLFTGLHNRYHRPADTAEHINSLGGATIVDLLEATLLDLATRPQPMAFREDPQTMRTALGRLGYGPPLLGIRTQRHWLRRPDGAAVRNVIADSPAAKAGIREGERIVHWNGEPVRGDADLLDHLFRHRPGAEVALGIVSATGQERVVSVVLAERGKQPATTPEPAP